MKAIAVCRHGFQVAACVGFNTRGNDKRTVGGRNGHISFYNLVSAKILIIR